MVLWYKHNTMKFVVSSHIEHSNWFITDKQPLSKPKTFSCLILSIKLIWCWWTLKVSWPRIFWSESYLDKSHKMWCRPIWQNQPILLSLQAHDVVVKWRFDWSSASSTNWNWSIILLLTAYVIIKCKHVTVIFWHLDIIRINT